MSDAAKPLDGPDFFKGVSPAQVADGAMLLGHVHDEAVLMARRGDELFAIGATCTHYGAPLADGLLVGDTIRCPWHHACFRLRSGEVLRAPALDPVACWRVEQRDGIAYVRERLTPARTATAPDVPTAIVIIGGGGAGNAAAEMLRELGYAGSITMLSADASPPYDRPNLSKGELAGTGPASVTPPRSADYYRRQHIDLKLNVRVARIDTKSKQVELDDGSRHGYDALLLATGADPVRLSLPGVDLPHVHYLRTRADCDALIAGAKTAKRAVVIGASFIGLEVAASLRVRGLDVQVVGLEAIPMEKVLGPEVGGFIRRLHEQHGVRFHLGTKPASIGSAGVSLQGGEWIDADLVVIGVGVRPNVALAERAGLATDRGITVNEYLETSAPGIFAAGDIARWPDPLTGERIRVEHWVVAERQGQSAARNMLGRRERFDAIPFFRTEQYDFGLAYVGHAEPWDQIEFEGRLDAQTRNCTIAYRRGGKKLAVAIVHRDLEGPRAEVAFERTVAAGERPSQAMSRPLQNAS